MNGYYIKVLSNPCTDHIYDDGHMDASGGFYQYFWELSHIPPFKDINEVFRKYEYIASIHSLCKCKFEVVEAE